MVRLIDLLEIIDVDSINLIASGEPKGVVKKNNIPNDLIQNKVIGIGMPSTCSEHTQFHLRRPSGQAANLLSAGKHGKAEGSPVSENQAAPAGSRISFPGS